MEINICPFSFPLCWTFLFNLSEIAVMLCIFQSSVLWRPSQSSAEVMSCDCWVGTIKSHKNIFFASVFCTKWRISDFTMSTISYVFGR